MGWRYPASGSLLLGVSYHGSFETLAANRSADMPMKNEAE
jgi:hypothetical protein